LQTLRSLLSRSGARHRTQVHRAEQGDPGGHALVFVPGWPDWKRPERVASDLDAFLPAV
jgi:hypothetical protein